MQALQDSVDAMMRCDKTLCFLSFHLRNLQKVNDSTDASYDAKLPAVLQHFTKLRNQVEIKKLDHVNISLNLFRDVSSDLTLCQQFNEEELSQLSRIAAYCERSLEDLKLRTSVMLAEEPSVATIGDEVAASAGLLPDFCSSTDPQLLEEMEGNMQFNSMLQASAH